MRGNARLSNYRLLEVTQRLTASLQLSLKRITWTQRALYTGQRHTCDHWIGHAITRRLKQNITLQWVDGDGLIGSTVVVLLVDGDRAACIWPARGAATYGAMGACINSRETTAICRTLWS
jgi:hypothetical protein